MKEYGLAIPGAFQAAKEKLADRFSGMRQRRDSIDIGGKRREITPSRRIPTPEELAGAAKTFHSLAEYASLDDDTISELLFQSRQGTVGIGNGLEAHRREVRFENEMRRGHEPTDVDVKRAIALFPYLAETARIPIDQLSAIKNALQETAGLRGISVTLRPEDARLEVVEGPSLELPHGAEYLGTYEIGGKSARTLLKEMGKSGIEVRYPADVMMSRRQGFSTLSKPTTIEVARISVKDLGIEQYNDKRNLFNCMYDLGLATCPAEVAPHLRLQYSQQRDEKLYVATDPILIGATSTSIGKDYLFSLERWKSILRLSGDLFSLENDEMWNPNSKFIVTIPQIASTTVAKTK